MRERTEEIRKIKDGDAPQRGMRYSRTAHRPNKFIPASGPPWPTLVTLAVALVLASLTLGWAPAAPAPQLQRGGSGIASSGIGPQWTPIPIPANFPAVVSPSMTYQGFNGTSPGPYVFFGGYDPATHLLSNSTWLVNTSGAIPVCPSGGCGAPSPRWGAILFYLDSGVSILYGGCGAAPKVGANGQLICAQLDSDLWVFEYNYSVPSASVWVKESCAGVTHPTSALAQGVGEAISINLGMMAGGETANGSASSQSWEVSNFTPSAGCTPYHLVWTLISSMPNPEIGGAIVGPLQSPGSSSINDTEFGGADRIGNAPNAQGNLLEVNVGMCPGPLCSSASVWSPLSAGSSNPPTFEGAALTSISQYYYLFGGTQGLSPSGTTYMGRISGSSPGGLAFIWSVDPHLVQAPTARAYAGYATGWNRLGQPEMIVCSGMATGSPLTAGSGCWWFG